MGLWHPSEKSYDDGVFLHAKHATNQSNFWRLVSYLDAFQGKT